MLNSYAGIRTFLKCDAWTGEAADVVVIGAPYDLGTSFRPGARHGPAAIRDASFMLRDGDHPELWTNPITDLTLRDAGDIELPIADREGAMRLIESVLDPIPHFLLLGGDHSITLPALRSLRKRADAPLALLHFDAHVDTWPLPSNHGTFLREAVDEGLVDPDHTVQIGIRSPCPKQVHKWTLHRGIRIITAEDVLVCSCDRIAEDVMRHLGRLPVYLTFDIDAIDPAQAPGTGTPEIGGLQTWQTKRLLHALRELPYIGMDIVEVAPDLDRSGLTALTAATLGWTYLCQQATRKLATN